jgi:hypothetical protein
MSVTSGDTVADTYAIPTPNNAIATSLFRHGSFSRYKYGIGNAMMTESAMEFNKPMEERNTAWFPQCPLCLSSQFSENGWQTRNRVITSASVHTTIRAPRQRTHLIIEWLGMMNVYMRRMESLLKQRVAFHTITKEMVPLREVKEKAMWV